MYKKFYGFAEPPFNITPDSHFLYLSRRHREALAALFYGIQHRKGFIMLTGEIGSGKTTLCRALIRELRKSEIRLAVILNSYLTELELLKTINEEFGLDASSDSKKALIDVLNKFLIEQKNTNTNCVLIIDESQNLVPEVLEQIRMISNLETETEKLIQIVLMGQPELRRILNDDRLEQLNQRITVRYHLKPLNEQEVYHYIRHRLNIAKAKIDIDFTLTALQAIYRYSRGVPRKINVVCDHALMLGYLESSYTINESMIERAILEVSGADVQQVGEELRRGAKGEYPWLKSRLFKQLAAVALFLLFSTILFAVITGGGRNFLSIEGMQALLNPQPDPTPTPEPAPTPTPTPLPGAAIAGDNESTTPTRATPRAKLPPVTAEMEWTYDSNDIVRVRAGYQATPAAELTLLAEWGIRPPSLDGLKNASFEELERTSLLEQNRHLGVRWVDVELTLKKALVFDLPLLLTINEEGGDSLSPHVVLRHAQGEVLTLADPIWGRKDVQCSWLEKRVAAIRVVYFDLDDLHLTKPGDKGPKIIKIQERLRELGDYELTPSGTWGTYLSNVIKEFQRKRNLPQTGLLDQLTALHLLAKTETDRPRLFDKGGASYHEYHP